MQEIMTWVACAVVVLMTGGCAFAGMALAGGGGLVVGAILGFAWGVATGHEIMR